MISFKVEGSVRIHFKILTLIILKFNFVSGGRKRTKKEKETITYGLITQAATKENENNKQNTS
jgi:hypothetical protein